MLLCDKFSKIFQSIEEYVLTSMIVLVQIYYIIHVNEIQTKQKRKKRKKKKNINKKQLKPNKKRQIIDATKTCTKRTATNRRKKKKRKIFAERGYIKINGVL